MYAQKFINNYRTIIAANHFEKNISKKYYPNAFYSFLITISDDYKLKVASCS